MDLDLGGAKVRFGMRAAPDPDQRVRLFRTGCQNAARPMIFEGPPDEMDIVRQKGRGQRIALISLIGAPVEDETDRCAAVDTAAGCGAGDLRRCLAGEE